MEKVVKYSMKEQYFLCEVIIISTDCAWLLKTAWETCSSIHAQNSNVVRFSLQVEMRMSDTKK